MEDGHASLLPDLFSDKSLGAQDGGPSQGVARSPSPDSNRAGPARFRPMDRSLLLQRLAERGPGEHRRRAPYASVAAFSSTRLAPNSSYSVWLIACMTSWTHRSSFATRLVDRLEGRAGLVAPKQLEPAVQRLVAPANGGVRRVLLRIRSRPKQLRARLPPRGSVGFPRGGRGAPGPVGHQCHGTAKPKRQLAPAPVTSTHFMHWQVLSAARLCGASLAAAAGQSLGPTSNSTVRQDADNKYRRPRDGFAHNEPFSESSQ